MHYYQFNIADYRKDTAHLTPIEHYIYRTLIDWYYLDEKPITNETQVVIRRLGIDFSLEQNLLNVLKDFFVLNENTWVHKRINVEIKDYQEKCTKNRLNGKLGGRPSKTQVVTKWLPDETQNNPTVTLTNNQEPITNINTLVTSKLVDDCPHQLIIDSYHEIVPELPRVKILTDKRKKLLKARWREDEKRQDVEFWRRFFTYVKTSDFLMGRTPSGWQANFEWLINSENFVKVIEGNYDKRELRS